MELLYRVGGLKGQEIGELFQVGYTSVSQGRRRLRDRLSDDRNAQDLFKRLLPIENLTIEELPPIFPISPKSPRIDVSPFSKSGFRSEETQGPRKLLTK